MKDVGGLKQGLQELQEKIEGKADRAEADILKAEDRRP